MPTALIIAPHFLRPVLILITGATAALLSGCAYASASNSANVHYNTHSSLAPAPASQPLVEAPADSSRQQQIQRQPV
jgi:hypothetical protein